MMTPFTELRALAAPLPLDNVNTDMIVPARFLSTIRRAGLGAHLFADLRRGEDGAPNDFVLNRPPFDGARILVTGANFGCGSSREHAPWALLDFGIRCVIAESFADIFYNNCFQNGILPAVPDDAEAHGFLRAEAEAGREFFVSLHECVIRAGGRAFGFTLDAGRRRALLEGLDEIDRTLRHESEIAAYESARDAARPWLRG